MVFIGAKTGIVSLHGLLHGGKWLPKCKSCDQIGDLCVRLWSLVLAFCVTLELFKPWASSVNVGVDVLVDP